MRAATARVNDDEFSGRSVGRLPLILLGFVLRAMLRRPRDSMAAVVAGTAAITILINALFMQSGPHPAPDPVGPAHTVFDRGGTRRR